MTTNVQNGQQLKFTKTETEYNMKSIRFLLLTITTMFIIIAGIMIVVGMSVYSQFHSFSFFVYHIMNGEYFSPSVICILVGMALLVVTMFGFFGSLKQSTCMVNTYAVILFGIFILKMVVVILAFTMDVEALKSLIYIPIESFDAESSNDEIIGEINMLQSSLNCCGAKSFRDYDGINFTIPNLLVTSDFNGQSTETFVPFSCCLVIDGDTCARLRGGGCKTALVNAIGQNASVLGVLGVSVIFINLLGIIFAVLLARCIRKAKSERALMAWKIKEQMILARQTDDVQKTPNNNNNNQGVYIAHLESSVA